VPIGAEIFVFLGFLHQTRHLGKSVHAFGKWIKAGFAKKAADRVLVRGGKALAANGDDLVFEKRAPQFLPHRLVVAVFEVDAGNLRAECAGDWAHVHGLVIGFAYRGQLG
jgi:hypothetical protein